MNKKELTQKRKPNTQPKSRAKNPEATGTARKKGAEISVGQTEKLNAPFQHVVAKINTEGMPYLTFKNLNAEREALRSHIGPKLTLEEFLKGSGQS